jgi:6-pyruvoyltetrahydropterin/6-carboxytetrahydropterin synthase
MRGLGRHYEADILCRGTLDPMTGYFINIKDIDVAARATLIPAIENACNTNPLAEPAEVLSAALPALNTALGGRLHSVRWRLTPYYSVEVTINSPPIALLRQQFEFAAAHRLHMPGISDQENRSIFGKCNNPRGHGHNYRVEPCVEVPLGDQSSRRFTLQDLEEITQREIINRLDHTHLNEDVPEFAPGKGVNPSVENIARMIYERLDPAIRTTGKAASLKSVTVWETDKTSCRYPA